MRRTSDLHRIRQAIFWLDQIEDAGLLLEFEEAIQQAYEEVRQRRNHVTVGGIMQAGALAHRVSQLLEEDETVCRRLADDYVRGSYPAAALATLKAYADRAAKTLCRRGRVAG